MLVLIVLYLITLLVVDPLGDLAGSLAYGRGPVLG
jgi:hypothetical protein